MIPRFGVASLAVTCICGLPACRQKAPAQPAEIAGQNVLARSTDSASHKTPAKATDAFTPGWYIVQPTAEFVVLTLAALDLQRDSTGGRAALARARIKTGEAILAFEQTSHGYLCFEYFGRMSAVRGPEALKKAPPTGRPGVLQEDVQLMDRVLGSGSSFWVLSIDAATGTATIQLDGGRREKVPNKSISVLANAFDQYLANAAFKPVE